MRTREGSARAADAGARANKPGRTSCEKIGLRSQPVCLSCFLTILMKPLLEEGRGQPGDLQSDGGQRRPDARVVELGEERQVVHVGDEDRDVLLERPEALLDGVDAAGVASGVAALVVVAALVLVGAVLRAAANVKLGLLGLGVVRAAVRLEQDVRVRRQARDEALGRADPVRELLGLRVSEARGGHEEGVSTLRGMRCRAWKRRTLRSWKPAIFSSSISSSRTNWASSVSSQSRRLPSASSVCFLRNFLRPL